MKKAFNILLIYNLPVFQVHTEQSRGSQIHSHYSTQALWPIGRGSIGPENVLLHINTTDMVSQEQIGKTIVRLRKLRGISQEKFALESGIDRRYLSDVENGKRNVSFELLNRVANYFKISLSYFIEEAEGLVSFRDTEELRRFLIEGDNGDSAFFTNPDFLDALLGINEDGRLVYSYDKMVESLVLHDNMSHEDATEFIDFNTVRAIPYMGKHAPIIVYNLID